MWNAVILPILTSLIATGLGIFAVWLYNRKRTSDKIANEIARITNEITAVKAQMEIGFNRGNLEKDILLNALNTVKTSIDVIEQTVANNSESITKLERQVETLTREIETLKQPQIINP